ncbi:MAG: GNAT family N-acetyltransferase [Terrimicrobiaceae bacterium]|nr:GNAT family N-acetyltransferase [Terrimicrobiaceae bacterium]
MISWLSFQWRTVGLPEASDAIQPLVIRPAVKADSEMAAKTIQSAFAMDPAWGDATRALAASFERALTLAFDREEPAGVVLTHGSRIIGASLLEVDAAAANHLLTGPCVLHEYRNRGLGSALLLESLRFLNQHGVSEARGLTRATSTAGRFVYPKFGGQARPIDGDPIGLRAA